MKKRVLLLILALSMLTLPLLSCGKSNGSEKLTVITTVFPYYDIARSVAGDRADVKMLLAPESESHTYEPSMADIVKVSEADMFIYTGGGADKWADDMQASLSGTDTYFMPMWDLVHKGWANENGEHDEHIWTSIENAKIMLNAICGELSALDPDGEEYYRANADAYREKLGGIDSEFKALMLEKTVDEVIIADRFPFELLFSEYGIKYTSALDGCGVGQEPSASVIAEIIEKVKTEGIEYIFVIEQSKGKTAALISEATGCKVLTLHSCHNVTADELSGGITYIDLMMKNADNLRLAMKCPTETDGTEKAQ